MKKIYKIITFDSQGEDPDNINEILTQFEIEKLEEITNDKNYIFFHYNGEICHWREGELMYSIIFVDEKELEEFKKILTKIEEFYGGYSIYENITEEVLFDTFDCKIFGYAEDHLVCIFHDYRKNNLTKDILLDKILKYGKDSLTENDILFLDDKEMIFPFL